MKKIKFKVDEIINKCMQIEGFGIKEQLLIFYYLLEFQKVINPKLNNQSILEIGVYKGRSLSLIHETFNNSTILAVDPNIKLCQLKSKQIISYNLKSNDFFINNDEINLYVSHLDSNHYYDNTKNELSFIINHSNDNSMIIIDDFTLNHSQVIQATYEVLKDNKNYLCLLISLGKCFIVHKSKFKLFEKKILNELQNRLDEHSFYTLLSRTNLSDQSKAFHLIYNSNQISEKYKIDKEFSKFY